MVEPGSIIVGGVRIAASVVQRWATQAGTLDSLIGLLDRRFGADTGLSLTQLQTWQRDQSFINAVFVFDQTGDWDESKAGIEGSVLGLTAEDPAKPTTTERALADEVVNAIRDLVTYAKRGDEVTRFEAEVTRAELGTARVHVLSTDWAPDRSQGMVEELAKSFPEEAVQLQQTLGDADVAAIVRGLVDDPPAWVREASGLLVETLAAVGEGTGQWEVALCASEEAAERAGGDRVRSLVRASIAAYLAGKPEQSEALFERAKGLEPEHPSVLFREARLEEDGEKRLSILERVEAANNSQRASLHAERAEAFGMLGRYDDAERDVAEGKELGVDLFRLEEVEAELAIRRNTPAWLHGERVDVPSLLRAADVLVKRRDEHRELRAFQGSVSFITRAVDAYLRADRTVEAASLLEPRALLEAELAAPLAREQLAEAALNAQRPDLVDQLLPEGRVPGEVARLMRATAVVQAGPEDAVREVLPVLDGLVDGALARHAALPRLISAVEYGADWSGAAENALRDSEPVLTALLKAKHLARIEQWSEAERQLLPYYDEPRVQHQLLGIALDEGDQTKVVRRAEDLLGRSPDFALRLDIARGLIRVGRLDLGTDELRRLAGDVEAPGHLRAVAYQGLTRFALESEHHARVAELTLGWLEVAADDTTPAWLHAQALLRLGRFADADAFLVDRQLEAQTLQEAQLAARIYALSRLAVEALTLIVKLADAQSQPDEDLEMMAVTVALQAGGLSERVNPTRFLEQFPDTTLMQAIPAPETEAEIRAFVEHLAGGRGEVTSEAEAGVFEAGSTPVAALAFAAGKQVGEVWGRMNRLPVAYADKVLCDLEVADALGALAVGAVWDPASVFMAGGLAGDIPARIRQALPKSVVAQSVLDDLVAEVPTVQRGEERMELGLDRSGQPAVTTWTEDAIRGDERRASGMLDLAREMQVEPDAPPEDDGPEAEFMREHELAGPLRTYGATFAVARRAGLAVFSDDRFCSPSGSAIGPAGFRHARVARSDGAA